MPTHSAKAKRIQRSREVTKPAPRSSRPGVLPQPGRGAAWRWGALALVALLAGFGAGIGIGHLRQEGQLPPLRSGTGPEPASLTRAAEARLSAAVQRAPGDAAAWAALGRLYLENGKPFEALWCLREAQRRDPKALPPRLLAARALTAAQLYRPAL